MRTKPNDVRYCGVRKHVIDFAEPTLDWENVAYLYDFIVERYKIHIKKDIKNQPKPWTKDFVLQNYRFTNVRREHDKQTKFLIENIVNNSKLTLEDKIVNIFMFRAWNNWDTMKTFGGPWKAHEIYSPKLKEEVRRIYNRFNTTDPKRKWWSNAYNQGGTKHAWKFPQGDGYQRAYKESEAKKYADWEKDIPLRPFHIGPWLKSQNIVERLLNSKDQQEAFENIKSIRGFADFLAYQVFVDLTYIPEFPFSENEFVVAGPGCKKGLDYIFINKDGMSYEECLFWLRDYQNEVLSEASAELWDPIELFSDLPIEERSLNIMSLENCHCELSKYIRAKKCTGRPRNNYPGGRS